jgi:hypothetical protein
LENESPAGPVSFVLDLVLEEHNHGIPSVLRVQLVVNTYLHVEQQKCDEQQSLLENGIVHSPFEVRSDLLE